MASCNRAVPSASSPNGYRWPPKILVRTQAVSDGSRAEPLGVELADHWHERIKALIAQKTNLLQVMRIRNLLVRINVQGHRLVAECL